MPYFRISSGLRGCYMPDNAFVARFTSRRELRAFVERESLDMIEAYGYGESKAVRVAIVAQVWRETRPKAKRAFYPYAIGFGRSRSKSDRPFGLFISHATRAEYLEYCKESD